MKLQFIYMIIGFSTLALNLILTLNLIKRQAGISRKEIPDDDDIITFRLTRDYSGEKYTTAAIPCDDTMPLEDKPACAEN